MKIHKNILEGIDEEGTPDMKYYAFDWDDNIMIMPTKIILKDDYLIRDEAIIDEIILHNFYEVDKNQKFSCNEEL